MSDLRPRAIVIGSLTDVLGTMLIGSTIVIAIAAIVTGADSAERLNEALAVSTPLQVLSLALGLTFTAVGGYVAARLAPGAERAQAFAVGVVSTTVGFLFALSGSGAYPFWLEASGLILTIPAAFAGGEIRRLTVGERRRTP
jgi:hypothetical protein